MEVWTSYNQGLPSWNSFSNTLRLIHAGIREDEWPKFVMEMFRVLKPGNGWAQCTESGIPRFERDDITNDSVLPNVNLSNISNPSFSNILRNCVNPRG